jgi:hypothetical protein
MNLRHCGSTEREEDHQAAGDLGYGYLRQGLQNGSAVRSCRSKADSEMRQRMLRIKLSRMQGHLCPILSMIMTAHQ